MLVVKTLKLSYTYINKTNRNQVKFMRLLYDKVYEHICKVDFESIWEGFHAYHFALYDDKKVYFKDKTIMYEECFLGNTSIKYDNEQIAIWKIDDYSKEDPIELAANMVHEMFHAYQYELGEKRFPNDIEALDYPVILENVLLKYAENQMIIRAMEEKDKKKIKEYLSTLIKSRTKRKELIKDHIDYEYRIETVEGMAEYAGLLALKQLDSEKYTDKINNYFNNLADIEHILFDNRRLSYFSGSLFLLSLHNTDISVFHDISTEKRTVYELISESIPSGNLPETVNTDTIETSLKTFLKNRQKLFDEFFDKSPNCREGSFTICGYDPMNMVKTENLVWCKYFVMLKEKAKDNPLLINGPLVIKVDKSDTFKVLAYYTI